MRIRTNNQILEVSNIVYDRYDHTIRTEDLSVDVQIDDDNWRFDALLNQLLAEGYVDLSDDALQYTQWK